VLAILFKYNIKILFFKSKRAVCFDRLCLNCKNKIYFLDSYCFVCKSDIKNNTDLFLKQLSQNRRKQYCSDKIKLTIKIFSFSCIFFILNYLTPLPEKIYDSIVADYNNNNYKDLQFKLRKLSKSYSGNLNLMKYDFDYNYVAVYNLALIEILKNNNIKAENYLKKILKLKSVYPHNKPYSVHAILVGSSILILRNLQNKKFIKLLKYNIKNNSISEWHFLLYKKNKNIVYYKLKGYEEDYICFTIK